MSRTRRTVGHCNFLMRAEHQAPRITDHRLSIGKNFQHASSFTTVPADAVLCEANSPDVKKLAEGKIADFIGFDVNHTGLIVRMNGRNEPGGLVYPNTGRDDY